uniref:histone-like nucleoid-structuring protein Lsr2 n=1 Tax=Arthrobacter sp. G119Y2 TaxID=3134965 RepID=UPI0031198315
MAQRVQVQLLDDITGEEAAETATFDLDGVAYEIDLTAENASWLREELSVYLEKGRKVRADGRGPNSAPLHLPEMNPTVSASRLKRTVTAPAAGVGSVKVSSRHTMQPTPKRIAA